MGKIAMIDEYTQQQITHYRTTAQEMGDAARDAMLRGDIGLARTSARLAAQHARVALQLETGERLIEPDEAVKEDAVSEETASEDGINIDPPSRSSGETIEV